MERNYVAGRMCKRKLQKLTNQWWGPGLYNTSRGNLKEKIVMKSTKCKKSGSSTIWYEMHDVQNWGTLLHSETNQVF